MPARRPAPSSLCQEGISWLLGPLGVPFFAYFVYDFIFLMVHAFAITNIQFCYWEVSPL